MVACHQVATYGDVMATTTDTSKGIARAVSAALRGAGIAQRGAAEATGIPITTLSRRLTGKAPFTTDELHVLADLVGCKVTDLISERAA